MQVGVGVQKGTDDKNYVILEVIQDNVKIQVSLTDQTNYEHDLDALIAGLTQMKKDMRTAASGLSVVKEVPDGLRSPQGRTQPRKSSTGKSGPRPATG